MPQRRRTRAVRIGAVTVGADSPIVVQSMTTTPTLDVEASVCQARRLADAGARLVRLTAQGVSHAAALGEIRAALRAQGVEVPLVADIHFNPAAAFEAARHVEKVRINPGNFFDPGRTFRKMDFTDEEYAAELTEIRRKFVPFLELCRQNGTAIRIGVNHGSLSDRIMSRYGDGAEGMVESALEYLRICRDEKFDNVVVSIKASDVPLMTATVRRLAEAMDAEGLDYPLHLGVTEAGNATEGRVKSAVGIGSLLVDGLGDTIRVSLSEDPCAEIPVAEAIISHVDSARRNMTAAAPRRAVPATMPVLAADAKADVETEGCRAIADVLAAGRPVSVRVSYPAAMSADDITVAAAVDLGYLILAGAVTAVGISSPALTAAEADALARDIVQATGIERFKAEIVACPGCGRTLFDLPAALDAVKKACSHLRHLKIAVMGCIVNGPGEMAGADYGYVGAAAGNVSIYRGIEPVRRNVPQADALAALIDIIKADGQWREAAEK